MFKLFGRSKEKSDRDVLEVELQKPVDCLCDFTYNFHWQHKGEKLDPSWKIPDNQYTFGDLVEHLKNGGDICIRGDAGHRLCSSMGTDLKYFGGTGESIAVGDVYVDGSIDTRMGISMVGGCIYVKGKIKEPLGNLVEVKSDEKGYRKFRSITDILKNGPGREKLIGCQLTGKKLIIDDGTVKDTVGARLDVDAEVFMSGNVDLSTGILMKNGRVRINGNAGKNTGALLNGGTVVINGDTDDFTAIDMKSGVVIVNGNAGKFLAANKRSGFVLAKKGTPIPPVSQKPLKKSDRMMLLEQGFNPEKFIKFE